MEQRLAAGRFAAYDTSHLVVLALLVAGAALLVRTGRAHRADATGRRVATGLALTLLGVTIPVQVLYLTPRFLEFERALPLQLCDLAWMASVYALWTRRRWAVGLVYYWGLTLTSQAVLTPDLGAAFPDPAFLVFWAMHLLVVWAAVYLTWGLGITPDWRSYRTTVAVTGAWAATAFLVNAAAGTNYGYLNAKPASASVLDLLGEWPWYVLAEVVILLVGWALLTWPWAGRSADEGTSVQVWPRQRASRRSR